MAEYSRLASGSVLSTGGQTVVPLPFIPNFIEITNTTAITAAASGVSRAWWMTDMGQGAAAYVVTASGPADGSHFVSAATGGGFSTIYAGLSLQYGPTVLLGGSGGIDKNANPTVTTTSAHGLIPGNWVVFQNLYETSSTGMQQIAGIPFQVVTVGSSTTFTIHWNTNQSNYTAITAGGLNTNASFKQILYPVLYAPGVNIISAITTGSTTTIQTTTANNYVVGQEVAFRIPTAWGTSQLNSLPNVTIPGSPIYGYVQSITDKFTFVVNINSSSYTAYNSNQAFASFPGEFFPQVVAVGDVNSGGVAYSGSALYPSPQFYNGFSNSLTSTINGPAISGAYCNNTFQGFIIGATIAGAASDQLYWRAYLHDMNT